jgi:hypothetical protein
VLRRAARHPHRRRRRIEPAADHELLAGDALRLQPIAAAHRTIRRLPALRDDALHPETAVLDEHGPSRRVEVLGVADRAIAVAIDQRAQGGLALDERKVAQIISVKRQ